MRKLKTLIIALLCIVTTLFGQQEKREITILGGFATTGSEFIFWEDNTYGGNVQVIYELTKFAAGFSAVGFKASGMFADGMTGGYGGLNIRIDEPFFFDLDALLGYSSISNPDLLYRMTRALPNSTTWPLLPASVPAIDFQTHRYS